ncbi:MAG: dihydroorotate oxidase [Candidatus Doudnabacteria bacterium CG10_big_fil_rev_8_21_14_0_10_42_18]|uniref:Dihydroorotate oxidase n=1 Tax=Candidatus Doudnabacteria bacterium CG10_big_fil_rev_8_21_14_0_10_42_18 TaxID=1974552 RepID=A0A2H0VAS6_9BACT|nr:MAG: dihydroorotate oxidase [Candidatus Doudnabacteria bacterium CG10_big_fil_rev_8_21_14_0_10_42_18]
MHTPFYDPEKSYEENFKQGPFGAFSDGKIFENPDREKYEFLGQHLNSVFGIPAGPLINGNFVKAALKKGFDICTYKTVRSIERSSHPKPNVVSVDLSGDLNFDRGKQGVKVKQGYREPLSITNSFGVPSSDPDFWQEDMKSAVNFAHSGQVVVGSFQGTSRGEGISAYIEDFATTARLVKETGVKILEVNLSCPNEGAARLLCFDISTTTKVVEAIKNEIGNTPLIIKLAYFGEQDQLAKMVKAVGSAVQGIQVINTIPAKILNENGKPFFKEKDRAVSGVCGSAIKWAGLDMTDRLKNLREYLGMSYVIMGVGGVASPLDYKEYTDAGADAVMSATGSMWNPFLAREIKKLLK